jgi:hypothetical protein
MRIWDRAIQDDERVSRVRGAIAEVVYLGSMTQLLIDLKTGERVTVHELNDDLVTLPQIGDPVTVRWAAEHSYIVSVDDESSVGDREAVAKASEAVPQGEDGRRPRYCIIGSPAARSHPMPPRPRLTPASELPAGGAGER